MNDDEKNADVDLNFMIHPVYKDISRRINSDAIKQSLRNIILTRYFERPFNPEFGCGIYDFLFENMDPITLLNMENSVREAIGNFEPRVELLNVEVTPSPDQHLVTVQVFYVELDREEPDSLEVVIERTR